MRISILTIFVALLVACAEPQVRKDDMAMNTETSARWAASCALCHVRGEGGAPVVGDAAAWQPRLAQGFDVLLAHTVAGYNSMPPLGYCMACERSDFEAMIRFMAEVR